MSIIATPKSGRPYKLKVLNNCQFTIGAGDHLQFEGIVIESTYAKYAKGFTSTTWNLQAFNFKEIDEPNELEIKLEL